MVYAEQECERMNLPPVDYEVGTEEVHGGLADLDKFKYFVKELHNGLREKNLLHCWPCFIVAKVGTDLHTSFFDQKLATHLYDIVSPLGSLIKGHYTDWVENPRSYPISGIGGANVGPEFTKEEYDALYDLQEKENDLCEYRLNLKPSNFINTLEKAVVKSGRWKKWLQHEECAKDFYQLENRRRSWLVQTGSRYVWKEDTVVSAREKMYNNLKYVMFDPHEYVVERISISIDRYINAFNLFDSLTIL